MIGFMPTHGNGAIGSLGMNLKFEYLDNKKSIEIEFYTTL